MPIKPLSTNEEGQVVQDRLQLQNRMIEANVWQCCLNCHHWGSNDHSKPEKPPGCHKWNQYPPAEVVTVGCPNWLSLIPF